MLTYKYTARNTTTGEKVSSEIEAENEQTAAKVLIKQGLSPLDIKLDEEDIQGFKKFFNKVRAKDKILFSRQLATLINAGLPLVQSLRSVANQTTSKSLKAIINKVISDVEAGKPLSVALSMHPKIFNRVYISLISAGEASGTLDKALERLAVQQEKDAEILSKVRGAMIYPIIVLAVMFAVVGFMVVSVLPQVKGLYSDIPGANLPFLTRILLTISDFIRNYWWLFITLVVIGVFFLSRWVRTLGGKRFIDKLKMRMWPIGQLFMKMYMARFARTGATLISTGVPLIQTLEITGDAVNNVHIEDSLKKATEKVRGGKSLSEALTNDPNFLELVPNMLKIGEQSGAIEQMMDKTASYYEREVDGQIKAISTIIEPVLMVILGIMAFIIVAAVLLPIYGLAGKSIIR